MAEHHATVTWQNPGNDFLGGRYSREHTWAFDGGAVIQASPAPAVVPPPMSNPAFVDPEEAYVASLSSCHMLTFLYLAGREKFDIEAYEDHAVGAMAKNEQGVPWVKLVTLRPKVAYRGAKLPTPDDEHRLHHLAHQQCFIAASVKTEIVVEFA